MIEEKYAYLITFYITNEFYVFQRELSSPNERAADNCQYTNGDVYTEMWLFQNINVTLIT